MLAATLRDQLASAAATLARLQERTSDMRRRQQQQAGGGGGSGGGGRVDRGVQAETSGALVALRLPPSCRGGGFGAAGPGAASTSAAAAAGALDAGQLPFEFQRPRRRVNWRRVHTVDLQQTVRGEEGARPSAFGH